MKPDNENFEHSGPSHLTTIDWNNEDHRRSVVACLVKGCSVRERDRQKKRNGSLALAPAWWESFNFILEEELTDEKESIFGAVYRYSPPNYSPNDNSPRYVIAFRGTLNKLKSFFHDLRHNVTVIIDVLHLSYRSQIAMLAVKDIVEKHGETNNIWLAGHSLGASIAMVVGKCMAASEKLMECFLFNVPFIALPIEGATKRKYLLRIARSVFMARHNIAVNDMQNPEEDSFGALSAWVPNIFVNEKDFICSKYIQYFKDMEMETIGRLSTQSSIVGNKFDPLHLVPSANLTVNLSPPDSILPLKRRKLAHELQRWWEPDMELWSKIYMRD